MKYFAYGSNMLLNRLQQRVGVVKDLGIATIPEKWSLDYSKLGTRDPSDPFGYANISIPKEHSKQELSGILYKLTEEQLDKLDYYEGTPKHYKRETIEVLHNNKWKKAFTYLATETVPNLKPKEWYLELIVKGALEHRLDDNYIKYLTRFGCSE